MKEYTLIFCFFTISTNCMNLPSKDPEIACIVKEMAEANRGKKEHLASLIYHEPFPEKVDLGDYVLLRNVCKPKHAGLLSRLLERKIIKPNTSAEFEGAGKRYALLTEAVNFALCENNKKFFKGDFYAAVKLLLNAGADANQESHLLGDTYVATTPVLHVLGRNNHSMLSLLLQHGAKANKVNTKGLSPLFYAVSHYEGPIEGRLQMYQCIEKLLDCGALLNQPSKMSDCDIISTPWCYVQELKGPAHKELIDLFNRYPHLKK